MMKINSRKICNVVIVTLCCFICLQAKANCKLIKKITYKDRITATVLAETIMHSGHYCLGEDIVTPKAYDYKGERYSHTDAVLDIQNSNVNINLQGRMIYADLGGAGAVRTSWQERQSPYHHIAIYNGIIKSRTNAGIYFGGSFISRGFFSSFEDRLGSKQTKTATDLANRYYINLNNNLAELRLNFPHTKHQIENVKVSAYGLGIGLKGGSNSITNSIIKVKNGEAVYLFGPNQLIENNIIIYEGNTQLSSSAAPIKIHAADGTIIRNNTIIIKAYGKNKPQTAISIFDSKNVVIENNKIFGTKSVYKVWDQEDKDAAVVESGTVFPPFWRKPRPRF